MAVRKHFNASAVNENDAVVNTLYKARTNGTLICSSAIYNIPMLIQVNRKIVAIKIPPKLKAAVTTVGHLHHCRVSYLASNRQR
jgi:hypothetical protein